MIYLKRLSPEDGRDIFDMLTEIGPRENSFTNPVHDMNFEEFKAWLVQQDRWSRNEDLPEGYVGQTVFWLYEDQTPVGIGKIRHSLTESSRKSGGNIGYAIRPRCRGRGYGTTILGLLLRQAGEMEIKEILLTVDKGNTASRRVCESNGGILTDENEERWFFAFPVQRDAPAKTK